VAFLGLRRTNTEAGQFIVEEYFGSVHTSVNSVVAGVSWLDNDEPKQTEEFLPLRQKFFEAAKPFAGH
jgi:hypothetical protein